jgi:hypothetical protein
VIERIRVFVIRPLHTSKSSSSPKISLVFPNILAQHSSSDLFASSQKRQVDLFLEP